MLEGKREMAIKNSSIEYTALDSERSCVCPFCGSNVLLNDLLFRSKRKSSIGADTVFADYCYKLMAEPEARGMKDLPSAVPVMLYDWRGYERQDMRIQDGIVTELTLSDGEICQERACPWCHNPVTEKTQKAIPMLFFSQRRELLANLIRASGYPVSSFAGRGIIDVKNRGVGFVLDNQEESTAFQLSRRAKLQHSIQRAVFLCELEESKDGEPSLDQQAQQWLRETLQKNFSDLRTGVPALVVLKTKRKADRETMEKEHLLLFSHLKAHFQTFHVCFWHSRDLMPENWEAELEWLEQIR